MTTPGPASDSFQRALNEASRKNRATADDWPPGPASGLKVRSPVSVVSPLGGGAAERWGLAMDWAGEPDEETGAPAAALSDDQPSPGADTPEAIANEMGLGDSLTQYDLTRRWRGFVWRNHPDRQPEAQRRRATARVAIANTLYDQARRAFVMAR